jgi:hypothetical protein
MSNYIIAIPSYNRYDIISNKTLKTLYEGNVSKNKIFIFVANKEQYKLYEETVDKKLYHKIIIGKLGITNQRIFISKYFPIGQYIVSLDDDIEEVSKLRGKDKLVRIKDLNQFFIEAYQLMRETGLYIWGIYPVRNPFFMKNKITYDLKFIIGMMYGYINRHDKKLYPSTMIETREDYEMSVLYYKMDGGVIRFNNINPKTKFLAEGGVGIDRLERNKKSAEYLINKYPDIFSLKYRKNGLVEVRMNKLKKENL